MAGGGGEGGSEFEVNINLTALLDVLTNLLFFLMLGFAAQQSNVELEGGFELPNSSAETQPSKTLQVIIARKDLRVEKEPVASLQNWSVVGDSGTGRIEALFQRLQRLQADKQHVANNPKDVLLVFCDKDVPYPLLHRVLQTAAAAGFPKFRMAVLME